MQKCFHNFNKCRYCILRQHGLITQVNTNEINNHQYFLTFRYIQSVPKVTTRVIFRALRRTITVMCQASTLQNQEYPRGIHQRHRSQMPLTLRQVGVRYTQKFMERSTRFGRGQIWVACTRRIVNTSFQVCCFL